MQVASTGTYERARNPEMDCDARRQVEASLEGMRIVIDEGICRLDEYDYNGNFWQPKAVELWPLSRIQAEEWLEGWNGVDRFKALHLLVRPLPD